MVHTLLKTGYSNAKNKRNTALPAKKLNYHTLHLIEKIMEL